MRGHIRKRGKTWTIVVEIGQDPTTGKRKQKWYSGFATKTAAEKVLAEKINQINKGDFADSHNQTLGQYLDYWVTHYVNNNVSYRTAKSYRDEIRRHIKPCLGQIKLDQLRPIHIQDFYTTALKEKKDNGRGLSPTSVLYLHRIIHRSLNQCVKWQLISRNPADAVQPPQKQKHLPFIPSDVQIHNILNEARDTIMYLPILLAITIGARRSEICGLRWQNIDINKQVIHLTHSLQRQNGNLILTKTKTFKSCRPIAISSSVVKELEEHYAKQNENKIVLAQSFHNGDFVCSWQDGRPIDPDYISKSFLKITNKIGLTKMRFHDLRHTHATILLEEGINPKVVGDRLGHADTRMTLDTYSHVLPHMQKEAAEKIEKRLVHIKRTN